MDPVKGTHCLERRRLRSCSDTQGASALRGLLLADLECSVRSMAYRFTLSPPRARVSVLGASSGLRSADADRDTSDRLLPPNQPIYLHPRSWLSSYLSFSGDEPRDVDGSRDTTFHDVVARFRRIVRSDPGSSPG